MTDFIAALADLILPELMGGYAPEYVEVVSEWSVLERMNGKGVCVRW